MRIAILATGDEIIIGDTLNTNSYQLAQALNSEGFELGLQLSCPDNEEELVNCLNFLSPAHGVIILIGGLGPTSDDRTRFALSRFLNEPLVEFSEALQHISQRLKTPCSSLNPGNKQQALFPETASLLPNPNGSAVGCYLYKNEKLYILLPGPPRECLPMFNNHVLNLLRTGQHSSLELLKWRVFGVAESQIAQQLDEALTRIDCQTGYRLDTPYVECKVRCKKERISQVQDVVDPLLAPFIIATPTEKASEKLKKTIAQLKKTVVIVDEITGGQLQTVLQAPENYEFLKFYPSEGAQFYFRLTGLKEYWLQLQQEERLAHLTIEYQYQDKKGQETYEIPYLSPLVVHYATEWSSFCLFKLINKLHERIT